MSNLPAFRSSGGHRLVRSSDGYVPNVKWSNKKQALEKSSPKVGFTKTTLHFRHTTPRLLDGAQRVPAPGHADPRWTASASAMLPHADPPDVSSKSATWIPTLSVRSRLPEEMELPVKILVVRRGRHVTFRLAALQPLQPVAILWAL